MLSSNNLAGVANILPSTIKNAIGQPPICDLERVVGRNQIVRYVEFELVKMSSLVSVGGNLNDTQVQFIAIQLVELFPCESLADFKLCFQRGCIGQYGEIYRMDGIVLRQWMEKYLDEKYQVVEEKLMREKEEHYKIAEPKPAESGQLSHDQAMDWFRKWKDLVNKVEMKKIAPLSEKEIREEGQERKKHTHYPSTSESEFNKRMQHLEYIKENYDARTGDKLPGWIPEETYLKSKK
jgi:hypothetical protein